MPFQSEKQRKYMWKHLPQIASKWSKRYGSKPDTDYTAIARKKMSRDVSRQSGR